MAGGVVVAAVAVGEDEEEAAGLEVVEVEEVDGLVAVEVGGEAGVGHSVGEVAEVVAAFDFAYDPLFLFVSIERLRFFVNVRQQHLLDTCEYFN